MLKRLILLLVVLLGLNLYAEEFDWDLWRGPDGNSVSKEKNWNPKAITKMKILWKKNFGFGYSGVQIKGKYLLTQGNKNNENTVYCLDPATGKEIWTYKYKCVAQRQFSGSVQTPIIFNNKAYVISRDADMFCFELATGKVVWQQNVVKTYGVTVRDRGYCANIKTYGKDKIFLNTGKFGHLFDAATGKKIWGEKGDTRYGVPVFYKDDKGNDCAAMWGNEECLSVNMKTGKRNWGYKWVANPWDTNIADAVALSDNRFYFTAGYRFKCAMLQVKDNKVKVLWEIKNMRSQISTPVHFDGFIYGIDGDAGKKGKFACVDAKTGKEMWSETLGFGNFMVADGKIIFLNERGKLHIFEVNSKKYVEIAQGDTGLPRMCWAMPVLCRGKIYCRSQKGDMVCVDVSK